MSAQKVWVFFIVETSSCIRVNVALSLFKETRGPVPALSEMSFPRGLPVLVSLNSIGKHVFFPCGAGKCNATIRQYNLMLLRSLYCWNRNSPADISNHCGCFHNLSKSEEIVPLVHRKYHIFALTLFFFVQRVHAWQLLAAQP